jgi:hypothetical protein
MKLLLGIGSRKSYLNDPHPDQIFTPPVFRSSILSSVRRRRNVVNIPHNHRSLFVSPLLRKPAIALLSLAMLLVMAGLFLIAGIPEAQAAPSSSFDRNLWIANNTVNCVLPVGDTTYIGGDFTYVGPNTGHGVPLDVSTGKPVANFPLVNGLIYVTVSDGAGGWYIGGNFTKVGTVGRSYAAHILANGSVDDWNPKPNNTVHAFAVSGSTVYIGGSFTTIQGSSGGPYTRNRLAAVDATTANPTAWNPNLNSTVQDLLVSGSSVYAGGDFTTIQGSSGGPYTRRRLAEIDTTTANPSAWNPDVTGGTLHRIGISGSTLYAGGNFTTIQGASGGPYTRNRLAAIDLATGTPTTWAPNANGEVYALAVSGSSVYAGGYFTSIPGTSGGPYARNYIAEIDMTTGNPTAWDPNANTYVYAIAVSGSTVYAGGYFSSLQGSSGGPYGRNRIAAIDATTANPTAWNPKANDGVVDLAVYGSTVYAGGVFYSMGGYSRNRLAAIDNDPASPNFGEATAWNPNVDGVVRSLASSGSTVYAGGDFTTIQGSSGGPYTRNRLAEIDMTTGNPTAWDPNLNNAVHALALSGSTLYAGGDFTTIQGSSGGPYTRNRLAAIDAATGNPTAWNPDVDATVRALALSGSTLYAGGDFTSIQGASGGPYTRNRLAAIDAATGNPTAWNPDVDATVRALALSGSTIYAGGSFTSIQGASGGPYARSRLTEIDVSTGNPTAWDPNANAAVYSLAFSGTTLYAGGDFMSIQGSSGGPYAKNRIAEIDAATANPTAWNAKFSGQVRALALSGTTVYAGGAFDFSDGIPCSHFAGFYEPLGVTSITPASGINDGVVNVTDLAGTYFRYGASVVKLKKAGQSDINATNVTLVSDTKITCDFDLTGAAAGAWNVYVRNPDGQSTTLTGGFTVENLPPDVTGINPAMGYQGQTLDDIAVSGSDFRNVSTRVELKRGAEKITAIDVNYVSANQITCDLSIPQGATLGSDWDVYVRHNDDGKSDTLGNSFTVGTAPATTWYLAEGCTGGDFETWVLVQNPGDTEVTVDLTFMTSTGPMSGPQDFPIPANSRQSFNVNSYVTDYNVSTKVEASGDVICERAMYGGNRTWAHDSIGYTP